MHSIGYPYAEVLQQVVAESESISMLQRRNIPVDVVNSERAGRLTALPRYKELITHHLAAAVFLKRAATINSDGRGALLPSRALGGLH